MAGRRARAMPATSGRWRSASTRTASCGSAGKVGSGFTAATRRAACSSASRRSTVDEPPFDPPPPQDYRGRWGGDLRGVTWVRPELVIRAELGGWSRDGMVRQAAFKGIERAATRRPSPARRAVATSAAVRDAEAETPRCHRTTTPALPTDRSEATPPKTKATDDGDRPATHRRSRGSATDRRARRPRRARQGRRLARRRRRAQADQPRQAAVRAPPSAGRPDHEARAHPLLRPDRADDAAAPRAIGRSTSSGSRTAPARPGSGRRTSPRPRPTWLTRWHETGVDGREDRDANDHLIADRVGDAVLARQPGQLRDPRLDRAACPSRGSRRSRYIDIDPGEKTTWDETLVLARLYRTALGHLGVRGYPKTTGKRGIQVWIPIVPKYDVRRDERVGREGVAGRRGDRARPRLLGVGEGRPQGPRPARLHPEREHQDARRAVLRAARRRRAGVGADHLGRAGRPGRCGPTAGRSGRSSSASREVGDLFAAAQTDAQELPRRLTRPATRPDGVTWHDGRMHDDSHRASPAGDRPGLPPRLHGPGHRPPSPTTITDAEFDIDIAGLGDGPR